MCSILPISLLPKCVPLNPVLISKCVKVHSNGNFISLTRFEFVTFYTAQLLYNMTCLLFKIFPVNMDGHTLT